MNDDHNNKNPLLPHKVNRCRLIPAVLLIALLGGGCASNKPGPLEQENIQQDRLAMLDEAARQRLSRWCTLIETGKGYNDRIKLEKVNALINQAEFILDAPQWGKNDYWATPYELLIANKGDCEDFSIAKYFTLRELGIADSKLRITYVKSIALQQAHMVLSYYARPGAVPLVLDNLNPEILPATSRHDLIPVYSFNGTGLWTAKARGDGKLVGKADRLSAWNELRNRMDDYTSRYLAVHADPGKRGTGLWYCQ